MVYFISDGKAIKIGYTKRPTIKKRLSEIAVGSSSKLYVLGYIKDGTLELEKSLHKQFQHINLEWYEATPELIEYINSHNDLDVEIGLLDGKLMVYKKIRCV